MYLNTQALTVARLLVYTTKHTAVLKWTLSTRFAIFSTAEWKIYLNFCLKNPFQKTRATVTKTTSAKNGLIKMVTVWSPFGHRLVATTNTGRTAQGKYLILLVGDTGFEPVTPAV